MIEPVVICGETQKGGRRFTETYTAKKDQNLPLLSVITVVYNSEASIKKTIQSVIQQTYPNIEHIIIDGASTDNTLKIIKSYNHVVSFWISEPDKGIYDAMNKGLKYAHGDYIWFLNSGDLAYSSDTISNIFSNKTLAFVYYGETVIINKNDKVLGMRRLVAPDHLSWRSFRDGMLVSHQSLIVKRDIAPKFDIKYKYCADFEWVIKTLKDISPEKIINVNQVVSMFLDGGRTKQTVVPGLFERFKIMSKYYGLIPTFFKHFAIGFRFILYVIKHKRF